jgi:DNA modification methylase
MKIETNKIYHGDSLTVLKTLPDECIDMICTSPPYWGLRDYGVDGQIGLEETPELYVQKMVEVFGECRRILKPKGTLWLNLGDTYYNYRGSNDYSNKQTISNNNAHKLYSATGKKNFKQENIKSKDLIGIPWLVAFALRADGWYLRQDIIWHKPNPMPESVKDRCTKAHEYIFLLSKSAKYYYDNEAIRTEAEDYSIKRVKKGWYGNKLLDGKTYNGQHHTEMMGERWCDGKANKRSVWTVNNNGFSEAHFATFPEDLIKPMILAGCPQGGIVFDPFMGAGTTALVALTLHRQFAGIELNPEYIKIAEKRIKPLLTQTKLFA